MNRKRIYIISLALVLLFSILFYFSLRFPLFSTPKSTVLYASNGTMVGAKIASDGQWRFPDIDSVDYKIEQCVLNFEDEYFYQHPGVNPVSLAKAFVYNLKHNNRRGGSTITMQTIRLARAGKNRSYWEKIIEIVLSFRLELSLSKKEILEKYISNAPFGGNVVGLEAACWRYYARTPDMLSWSEAATLSVLPNAPSLIYPGKNQVLLKKKRDFLLKKLYNKNIIDSLTYISALAEELPQKPNSLPRLAPHFLEFEINNGKKEQKIHSSIDENLQTRLQNLVQRNYNRIKHNQIHNIGAVVYDLEKNEFVSYIGNTVPSDFEEHSGAVDVVQAHRSTGSILKPFLYAAMLTEGDILPNTLIPDIPTFIAGYTPKNFDLTYSGAVPAKMALSRSLNIPSVKMLQEYRIEKFIETLKKLQLKTINKSADHYGLSLVLGGAEASLYNLVKAYADMANQLKNHNSSLAKKDFPFSASAIWFTNKALLEVNRPDSETGWENFESSSKIAWKTGTSFGNRDAWAIGYNSKYVVGVWCGNADGEGRPDLTGTTTAAPILFEIVDMLPQINEPFPTPFDDMKQVEVCKKSGHRALDLCDKDTVWINKSGLKTAPCPYHKLFHLDKTEQYRVNSECEVVSEMVHKSFFVLPPVQEWYYKSKNPTYKILPPFREDCEVEQSNIMAFIFPQKNAHIYLPKNFAEQTEKVVYELAHRKYNSTVYWHLDHEYIGQTTQTHKIEMQPDLGNHILTVVDNEGNSEVIAFEISNK